nr:zinc finger MYM-type protein 1-like [Setaria viridis]
MAVVVRFVNDKGSVIKRFLGLQHVSDTTSSSLKEALVSMLAKYGLSISKVRGQGYDGASNMRGHFHGLQRLVLNENPFAFYIHCFAHQLQLVVVAVARCCASTDDFFNYVTSVVNTVSVSCKRKDQLLQKQHDILVQQLDSGEISPGRGKNQETSLARPGDTRWGTHHKTLVRLLHMWEPVLEVLENISDDGTDGEKKTIASRLIEKMESFQFVFILHLMIRVLGITEDLSQCLQMKNQNIVRAIGLIGSVMRNINAMRENGWDNLFEEVKAFAVKQKIDFPYMEDMIPVRGRSKCRGAKLVTYYHHFHHGIFIVVLDQVICELSNRFPERSTQLLRCVSCLDPTNEFANFEIEKLVELAKIYYADFSDYECAKLRTELENFIDEVKHDEEFCTCIDLGSLAEKMVQTDIHTHFPLVYRLIELALILPVATATVERAFSAMNIIKTDRRNKMNDDWMNDSMLCYIERDLFAFIEDDKILTRFQGLRNRKINLPRKVPSSSGIGSSGVNS